MAARAQQGEWQRAVENSWLWLAALPFAEAPGVFGSYQASLGGDYAQGAALARAALLANPDEFLLRNNLAYCLLQLDLLGEAEPHLQEMARLDRTDLDHVVFLATNGLRAFRAQDVGEGRRLYREAIQLSSDPGLRAAATISLAREEVLAGTAFCRTDGEGSNLGCGSDAGDRPRPAAISRVDAQPARCGHTRARTPRPLTRGRV